VEGQGREALLLKYSTRTLLVLLLAIPCRGRAETAMSDAPKSRIVVLDAIAFVTAGVPKTVHERERFFATLRKSLGDKGWTVVLPSTAGCDSDECLSKLSGDADAPYALRISGEGSLVHGYTLDLALYSHATAQSRQATAFCDLCATDRMAGIAADFTIRLIAADAAKERPAPRQQAQRRPTLTPETAKPAPPLSRNLTLAATPPSPSRAIPVLSSAMIGVGLVGVAYGSWALYKDGDFANSQPGSGNTLTRERYASTTVGATSLAIGGALALVGTILLVTEPRPGARLSLTEAPGGIAVGF